MCRNYAYSPFKIFEGGSKSQRPFWCPYCFGGVQHTREECDRAPDEYNESSDSRAESDHETRTNKGPWSVVWLRCWSMWWQGTSEWSWPFVARNKARSLWVICRVHFSLCVTSVFTSPSPEVTPLAIDLIPNVEQRTLISFISVLSSPSYSWCWTTQKELSRGCWT